MALSAGARLGPYEVLGPIGAGGMGEVYRARDTRLGREVAIKVMPADRLSDPHRRARFVQEARAASALNHPNIVTIHDIESAESVDFIVMEFVAGKTLDALIPRHGMRLGEALRVAIPLADALAAAHAAGIVHRDLKPANVMVTPEGVVKVLDFGLAKLTQAEQASGEDATTLDAQAKLSRPGTVAGTPAYMSPEQASGGAVDARSDIFSFGAVLYEMVTGRRPFGGGSSAEMLVALLKEQPKPPSEIAPDVPKELERIILRCLRKEPERRFQHATDLKVELQEVKEESDSQAAVSAGAVARRSRRVQRALAVAGVVLLLTVAAALWYLRQGEPPTPRLVPLTAVRHAHTGSFSPDGSQIAFAAAGESGGDYDIWLRIVGEAEARRLTTGPANDRFPAWSPDGKQIAFVRWEPGAATGAIHVVSPLGGPARRLADFPAGTLSWSPDARWLATARLRPEAPAGAESHGIHLIPVQGGEPRAVTTPEPPAWHETPAFSPDGRALAYISCAPPYVPPSACDVDVVRLDAEDRPQGPSRRVTAQRFDPAGLAWTRNGRSIVYAAVHSNVSRLWRVRADGGAPPALVELAGRGTLWPFTATSRDRLVFLRRSSDVDIYRLRAGRDTAPLLASTADDIQPQYSPDGQQVAFESRREGDTEEIWLVGADGSNPARLTRGPGRYQGSPRWSPDARAIVFDSQADDGHWDVWTIRADGSGLRQVTHNPADDNLASWSRDGRWIYFGSNRTGRFEIWRVAAVGGVEEQVTRKGGWVPFESLDGRTLYYKRASPDSPLLAQPTTGGEERTVVGCVGPSFSYAVDREGITYVACDIPAAADRSRGFLRHWNMRTAQDRLLATLDTGDGIPLGLSVSPDGQSILYTHTTSSEDLMMIENFR
jgi:eukaryotic-like serine/threonine-protein kinase